MTTKPCRTENEVRYLLSCGIFERYHDYSLDFYGEPSDNGRLTPREVVQNYLSDKEAMVREGIGLYLWGDRGRGKTSLMNIAFREIVESKIGINCHIITFAEFVELNMNSWKDYSLTSQIKKLKTVRVLGIDDLGRAVTSTPDVPPNIHVTLLDSLLRYRVQRKLTTWFTSNCDTKTIGTMYSEAIRSLMKESVRVVSMKGSDLRDEEQTKIKKLL